MEEQLQGTPISMEDIQDYLRLRDMNEIIMQKKIKDLSLQIEQLNAKLNKAEERLKERENDLKAKDAKICEMQEKLKGK